MEGKSRLGRLLVSVTFLLLSAILSAQSVKGVVVESGSEDPVFLATVFLEGTNHGVLTDSTGKFVLPEIEKGEFWLIVSTIGYQTYHKRISIAPGVSVDIKIYLEKLDLQVPEVVIRAQSLTGGGAGLRQIPGAAHYISPEELEQFQYTDIHRVLQKVPGVNIQDEDGFGLRPNIGLRGTGVERSSKVTVMEDGVLMSPAPYAAPAAYYFPSIGRMQGVEVMKGGSQVRFGPFTTGGAINLISTAIPSESAAKIKLQGGNLGYRQIYASAGTHIGQWGLSGETFQFGSNGFKKLPENQNTPIDRKDYLLKARWRSKPTKRIFQSIQIKVGQSLENSDETYMGLTEEDFIEDAFQRYAASSMDNIKTDHKQYSLQYVISDPRGISFQTTLYRNDFYRNWYKSDYLLSDDRTAYSIAEILTIPDEFRRLTEIIRGATTTGEERIAVKANQREYFSQGVQSVIGYRFSSGNWRHTIDLSYRYHEDQMDRFQWVDLYAMDNAQMTLEEHGIPGTESNRIESARAHAAYIQYKIESEKLTVIPGLRYENILMSREDYGKEDPGREGSNLVLRENKVQVWIPGVGVHYAVSSSMDLFGGVHRGFAPPGNKPGTNPEFSINYEIGLRKEWIGGNLQVAGFFNDYRNLLGLDLLASGGGGSQDLFNGGEATIYGMELMLDHDLGKLTELTTLSIPVFINYTLTKGQFDHDFDSDFEPWGEVVAGDELPYLPIHQLAWGLGLIYKQLSVQITGKWNDQMRTVAGQGVVPENVQIPSYHLIDMAVSWRTSENLNFNFRIQNVFNNVYLVSRRPAGLRPGLPRLIVAGMQWSM